MAAPPLVLGSSSPRRQHLLAALGYRFSIAVAEVQEEASLPGVTPAQLTVHNALLKANAVAIDHPGHLIIGADTLVFLGDQALGKPADLADARRMLRALSGRTHTVISGVALVHAVDGSSPECFATSTQVTFHPLDDRKIDAYLSLIDPLDKAGAYAAQDHGTMVVASILGAWSNVVGLPVEDLAPRLVARGLSPSKPPQPAALASPPGLA